MARLEHENKHAPVGMNDHSDLALMAEARARWLVGVSCKHEGVLEESLYTALAGPRPTVNSWPTAGQVQLVFPYIALDPDDDCLIVVRNGVWYTCTAAHNAPASGMDDAIDVTLSDLTAISPQPTFATPANKRLRAVQYRDEVVVVAEGFTYPILITPSGTGGALQVRRCGMHAPEVAPVIGGTTLGGLLDTGSYDYLYTYVDWRGRESSPSARLTAAVTSGSAPNLWLDKPPPRGIDVPANATYSYVYRTAKDDVGGLAYRIKATNADVADQYKFDLSTISTPDMGYTSDTDITEEEPAPLPGENDPPAQASLVAVHKDRIALNSVADAVTLQLSNTGSPTQFSVLADPSLPTDGMTIRIASTWGDEITALGGLGSVLGLLCRRSVHVLMGDNINNFEILKVHNQGCIAPDTVQVCENRTVFMGESQIYAMSYQNGFVLEPLGADLEEAWHSVSIDRCATVGEWPPSTAFSRADRAARAIAWFAQGRYYLCAPPWVYVYDFDREGWSLAWPTYMPGAGGVNGGGYLTAHVCPIQRQYEVCLYAPLYPGGNSTTGEIWAASFYPAKNDALNSTWPFVYETRAIDGAGVARNSLKRLRQTEVYGEIVQAGTAARSLSGTITCVVDGGVYEESHPFDIDTKQFERIEQRGMLWLQQWSPKCTGRILQVRLEGSACGRLAIRDEVHQYVRLT